MSACELFFTEDGSHRAPPLLLGPSLGTSTAMWDPNVARLGEYFRVIRYDHRGEGNSPVPPGPYDIGDLGRDVLALMDRLAIERTDYAGVSLGAMVGMWIAANAPERIHRLVLICTAAHLPPASLWQERASAVREAGTVAAVADAVSEKWLTPQFAEQFPGQRERLRDMLASQPAAGYAECCGVVERLDLRLQLGSIEAPTLVIAGREDQAAPPDRQQEIADAIPGARLEVISPAAHIASFERAATANGLILGHLDVREAA